MTAPYTYNQLINWFSSFADNHYQLHYFGHGDFWEAMESNQANHKLFPILWVNPVSSSLEFPNMKTKFQVLAMDLVNTDESNEDEVLSDMQLIMQDLKTMLDAPAYQNLFWVEKAGQLTPFTEKFSGKVSGWMMEIEIKVKWQKDNCAVPLSGAPSGDNVCRPVTIYDTNGNIITTVASGGSYIVTACADATVTVNSAAFGSVASGGTLNVPVKNTTGANVGTIGGGQVTAPDATAVVKNSLNTTLATEAIPSGVSENIALSDVNNVNSDGVVTPTPAGVAFTCTPQVKSLFSKFTWESGDDTSSTITIDADSAGTYTSQTTDGSSGSITYSKNGAAYAAFVNPTTYANGDTLAVKRTVTTALGWAKISGTYV